MASSAVTDPAPPPSRPRDLGRSDVPHDRPAAPTGVLRRHVYKGDDRAAGANPQRQTLLTLAPHGLVRNDTPNGSPRGHVHGGDVLRGFPMASLVCRSHPNPPGGLVRDDMPAVVPLMWQALPSSLGRNAPPPPMSAAMQARPRRRRPCGCSAGWSSPRTASVFVFGGNLSAAIPWPSSEPAGRRTVVHRGDGGNPRPFPRKLACPQIKRNSM